MPTKISDRMLKGEGLRALLKRVAAEAGFNLVDGSFEEGGNLVSITDVLWYQADGKYYNWYDGSAKTIVKGSTPASTGGIGAGAWVDRTGVTLRSEVDKPVISSEFSGGADPTGATSSDAAFSAAGAYEGCVRVEGTFTLTDIVTRTKSVMELPPGSTITKNKLAGPSTENGANIPSKTMFGRLVIRDEDVVPSGPDSFTTYPDMGQALRIDSKQVKGQCGIFIGGDKKNPVISSKDYVGLHSRHSQSLAVPRIWGYNPVIVKNIDTAQAADNRVLGAEISLSNNTSEAALPQRSGALEGLFISYIHTTNKASAAITTGGLSAGFNHALWLDGVPETGVHISLRDEVSANAGARRGLDTSGVSHFTEGAVLLGHRHSINSVDANGALRTLLYINSANEVIYGQQPIASRFLGTVFQFDGPIRPTVDNTYDYGSAVLRGRTAFFGTGTINTSDETTKHGIRAIAEDDALLDAWAEVDWYKFQFIDAVEVKGADGARWHLGLVAQRVRDVLDRHGIDGFKLGLLCYDKWDDQYEQYQVNEGETVTTTKTVTPKDSDEPITMTYEVPVKPIYGQRVVREAGELYGIRYEEALSLEAALQRRNYQRLLARVEALEAK